MEHIGMDIFVIQTMEMVTIIVGMIDRDGIRFVETATHRHHAELINNGMA